MKRHLPAPATALAGLALFVSLGGTSVAAISYASRAGSVDGKSAVSASSSLSKAAGKLVATNASGTEKGKLPGKFVTGVAHATTFGSYVEVTDNATGAATRLAGYSKVGSLSATCTDENGAPSLKDPLTTLTFTNTAGDSINYSARLGINPAAVLAQPAATTQTITVRGSNTFEIDAAYRDIDVRIDGNVRQDGRNTADAKCLVYGTLTLVN